MKFAIQQRVRIISGPYMNQTATILAARDLLHTSPQSAIYRVFVETLDDDADISPEAFDDRERWILEQRLEAIQ